MGFSGLNLGFGIQRLIDAQQRFVQNSRTPINIRLRNFTLPQQDLYAQLGYSISPSGSATGMTDVQILPPPATRLISMHTIGMSSGKLLFGAREFVISGSFVDAQQKALGLSSPDKLWWCNQFVGIFAYGILFTVVDYAPEEIGGKSVVWTIRANASELK
jgi:hypothetical protein